MTSTTGRSEFTTWSPGFHCGLGFFSMVTRSHSNLSTDYGIPLCIVLLWKLKYESDMIAEGDNRWDLDSRNVNGFKMGFTLPSDT